MLDDFDAAPQQAAAPVFAPPTAEEPPPSEEEPSEEEPSAPQPPRLPATQFEAGTVRAAADGTRWRVVEARQYRGKNAGLQRCEWELVVEEARPASSRRALVPWVPPPSLPRLAAQVAGLLGRLVGGPDRSHRSHRRRRCTA